MRPQTRDAWLICAAAALRSAAVGAVGVTLGIVLARRGYSLGAIGVTIGVGLTGATLMTAVVAGVADRIGRRHTLIALTALMALGYIGVAVVDRVAWLLPVVFIGMVNGMGRDRGPAGALEQAMLPETTDDRGRTWVMAGYSLVLDGAHAIGALGGAIPPLLVSAFAIDVDAAHRLTILGCAIVVGSAAGVYSLLSAQVEPRSTDSGRAADRAVTPETRAAVHRLAVLFGIDSLGGGFLSSALIAYWFLHRYGLSEGQLAVLFFTARVLNAVSHLGAAWLARRIGLLNTMVFTHLPSSVLLMSAPIAPSAALACALFLCREALVEMDVPTRQSYVMAIVPTAGRTYASAVTNLTRTAGWALGPAIAGLVMQHLVLAGPLFVAGALKIGYDVVLYRSFRHLKPPEEIRETLARAL